MIECDADLERFMEKIDFPSVFSDCWYWNRSPNSYGYGQFWLKNLGRSVAAHRVAYVLAYGDVPPGTEIDHLCRVRHCVNPLHLEAVTQAENNRRSNSMSAVNARKTHCKNGHPFDSGHMKIIKNGRCCWTCKLTWQRKSRAELKRKSIVK